MFHVDTIGFNIIYMAYIMFLLYITENAKIRTEWILPDYQSQAFNLYFGVVASYMYV